jgi:hypothetical protein
MMGAISKVHRDLPILVLWLVVLIGLAVVLISEKHPLRFVGESSLLVALVELELAFILLVWPLWLGRSLKASEAPREVMLQVALQIGALFLIGLPINLIAQAISNASASTFAALCAVLMSTQLLVGSLYVLGASLRLNLHPYYYLGVFVTQALLPFLGYLLVEFTNAESLSILKIVSPFWTIAEPSTVLPSVVMAISAGIVGAAASRIKPVAPPPPSQ